MTPAGRPTWQDLLGRAETPKPDENHSPSERILWRSDLHAAKPVVLSPLLPRKARKRARSSSPVSSPASKSTTPAVDIKKLAQVLKTPRADPALELWDRFSLPATSATSPSGRTNPLLAQLMVSSSPRPPKEGAAGRLASERPLRKSVSCGANWPKRRKVERTDGDPAEASAGTLAPDSKSHMVSALLETVDGEIKKSKSAQPQVQQPQQLQQQRQQQQPASPSPQLQSPQRKSPSRPQPGSSPLAQKSTRAGARAGSFAGISGLGDKPSSDYGDDDFDDETLLELDASIHLAQEDDPTQVASPGEAGRRALPAPKASEDDFGDLDDDFFDGAVDLVAEVEAKHLSQNHSQGKRHAGPVPDRGEDDDGDDDNDDDDDAYGDDFGDDVDLDAIELAATQAASRPFSSNVRAAGWPTTITARH